MEDPKDVVTLAVQMDQLPDGTNHVQPYLTRLPRTFR